MGGAPGLGASLRAPLGWGGKVNDVDDAFWLAVLVVSVSPWRLQTGEETEIRVSVASLPPPLCFGRIGSRPICARRQRKGHPPLPPRQDCRSPEKRGPCWCCGAVAVDEEEDRKWKIPWVLFFTERAGEEGKKSVLLQNTTTGRQKETIF
ncbi:hypothetical protein MRB53_002916 [Persea americana]|uniref:Uncharacterized protein n=1 Tax=Persea americana TaxID=3435 RepID=A0ACC2MWJ2_PERAE|nr:hypothetical protein MRB53_002916 [Persea americana]